MFHQFREIQSALSLHIQLARVTFSARARTLFIFDHVLRFNTERHGISKAFYGRAGKFAGKAENDESTYRLCRTVACGVDRWERVAVSMQGHVS
jgi:hypothetical protein